MEYLAKTNPAYLREFWFLLTGTAGAWNNPQIKYVQESGQKECLTTNLGMYWHIHDIDSIDFCKPAGPNMFHNVYGY